MNITKKYLATYHQTPSSPSSSQVEDKGPSAPAIKKAGTKRVTRNQGAKQKPSKKQRVSTTKATEHIPAPEPGSARARTQKVTKRAVKSGQSVREQSVKNYEKYLSSTARNAVLQDIKIFQDNDYLNLQPTKITGPDHEWTFPQHTKALCLREPITELVASLHTFENGAERAFTPDDWPVF